VKYRAVTAVKKQYWIYVPVHSLKLARISGCCTGYLYYQYMNLRLPEPLLIKQA
jgi:hypothetical protein